MKDVCRQCHGEPMIEGFYLQFDNLVDLYNTKFAIPAQNMRQELIEMGKLSKANFDDELDWIFWELWHHEGRRARHGASMSGPDYAWWHGLYEVAKHFYSEFIPEVEHLLGWKAGAFLDKHVYGDPRHSWHKDGMTKEELKKLETFYDQRYGGEVAK